MTILFDGIASGMLLFLISVGLSVTLGLMNFVNLAHGAFAMIGGYACVVLLNDYGVPFLATLPFAALVPALVGIVLERTLYRRLYTASDLDQVLFSLGLVFMAVAGAHYFFGTTTVRYGADAFASPPTGAGTARLTTGRPSRAAVGSPTRSVVIISSPCRPTPKAMPAAAAVPPAPRLRAPAA